MLTRFEKDRKKIKTKIRLIAYRDEIKKSKNDE